MRRFKVKRLKGQKMKVGSRLFKTTELPFIFGSNLASALVAWHQNSIFRSPAQHEIFNCLRGKFVFARAPSQNFISRRGELHVRPAQHEILHGLRAKFFFATRDLWARFSTARDWILGFLNVFSAGVAGERRFAPTVVRGQSGVVGVARSGEHAVRPYRCGVVAGLFWSCGRAMTSIAPTVGWWGRAFSIVGLGEYRGSPLRSAFLSLPSSFFKPFRFPPSAFRRPQEAR
jgi:hypothetical protein